MVELGDSKLRAVNRLPPELWLEMSEYLGYPDAIFLSQVNRLLYNTIDPQKWPVAEKLDFLREAAYFSKHNTWNISHQGEEIVYTSEQVGLGCTLCFKVRPLEAFDVRQYLPNYPGFVAADPKVGVEEWRRECVDCCIAKGMVFEGREIKMHSKIALILRSSDLILKHARVLSSSSIKYRHEFREFTSRDLQHMGRKVSESKRPKSRESKLEKALAKRFRRELSDSRWRVKVDKDKGE